ncbi:family 31 glycoside hydrolase [Phytophthora cinnamomi]|uniref:family 31 glycoside hydrolase n=1 Tax=Phytophthora cinnamomi TaxID=4785 RepID=UPI00355A1DB8|nr:family 31 glycoside hydrolase [Phytophthora cinnamomi]
MTPTLRPAPSPSRHGHGTNSAYPANDGWFQFDASTATFEFVFNDGVGVVWDNNNYKVRLLASATTVPRRPPAPSGKFSAANGWFQYDISSTSSVEIAFNDGNGIWDSNLNANYRDSVRVKIVDKNNKRSLRASSPPAPSERTPRPTAAADPLYTFNYTQNPFTFKVVRKSDGYTLFDSSGISLVVKDQYLQASTVLGSDLSVYGIGESTRDNFKMASGDKQTLWARDQGSATPIVNTYGGSHPFFLGINSAGQAHGVLLLNSNGM